jgi:CMP-2-keto-3-deoxyoctulosonic acid synthetase
VRLHLVLPARLGSTRLPRKMLADVGGVPLVVRAWARACAVPGVAGVHVATDSAEIAAVARAHGASVLMTSSDHASGTERVAEAARRLAEADPAVQGDAIVNVQADEPFLDVALVARVAAALGPRAAPGMRRAAEGRSERSEDGTPQQPDGGIAAGAPVRFDVVTAAAPLDPAEAPDPARVKVVCGNDGAALYFSRAPIPHGGPHRVHVGLYAFTWDALQRAAALPREGSAGALEAAERLEQLRWLAHGLRIGVVHAAAAERSVDTPEDLAWARMRLAGGDSSRTSGSPGPLASRCPTG